MFVSGPLPETAQNIREYMYTTLATSPLLLTSSRDPEEEYGGDSEVMGL